MRSRPPLPITRPLLVRSSDAATSTALSRATGSGHRAPRERLDGKCLRQHEGRARGARSKRPRIRPIPGRMRGSLPTRVHGSQASLARPGFDGGLSDKPNPLYESHHGRFGRPRKNRPGGQSGSSATEFVHPRIVTLCQTHKKPPTTLVCPTAVGGRRAGHLCGMKSTAVSGQPRRRARRRRGHLTGATVRRARRRPRR